MRHLVPTGTWSLTARLQGRHESGRVGAHLEARAARME